MRVSMLPPLAVAVALAACGPPSGDLMVHIPPHLAASGFSAQAQARPRNVALPPFAEASADPARIGDRSVSGSPAGGVLVSPTPAEVLHDAFAAELRHAGHTLANEAGVTIEGKVTAFAVRLSPTSFGWQMVLEAGVALAARSDALTVNHAYTTRCADRAVSAPGVGAITALIEHCVDDLAIQFRSDTEVAHVLGAP
jgi:YajG family uncharacterized lipoprotein